MAEKHLEESKEDLEKQILQKENEKLDLELKNLQKKWLRKPQSWTGVLLPALASIITVVYAISTDFFGIQTKRLEIERAELNREIKEFRARKDTLSVQFDRSKDSLEVLISVKEFELDSLEERLENEQEARMRTVKEKDSLLRYSLSDISKSDSLRTIGRTLLSQNFGLTKDLDKANSKIKRLEDDLSIKKGIEDSLILNSRFQEENISIDFIRSDHSVSIAIYPPIKLKDMEVYMSSRFFFPENSKKEIESTGIKKLEGTWSETSYNKNGLYIYSTQVPRFEGSHSLVISLNIESKDHGIKYSARRRFRIKY